MQTLYIMRDDDLGDELTDLLGRQYNGRSPKPNLLIQLLERHVDVSAYDLPQELANLPELARKLYLFGVAFDNGWSAQDVYMVMVQDGEVQWASHE